MKEFSTVRNIVKNQKYILVYLFAVFGVALLAWTAWPYIKGRSSAPPPSGLPLAESPSPGQDNSLLPSVSDYRIIKDESDVADAMNDLQIKVQDYARSDDVLRSLGEDAARTLAKTATMAIGPFVSGSFEEYRKSVITLGGDPSTIDTESQANWGLHRQQFALKPISIKNAKIVPYKGHGERGRMTAVGKSASDEGYGRFASTQVPNRYPAVDDIMKRGDPILYEMRLPLLAQAKDSTDGEAAMIGVIVVWDAPNERWLPLRYTAYSSIKTREGINLDMMY